jgi:hypothetical protein
VSGKVWKWTVGGFCLDGPLEGWCYHWPEGLCQMSDEDSIEVEVQGTKYHGMRNASDRLIFDHRSRGWHVLLVSGEEDDPRLSETEEGFDLMDWAERRVLETSPV